MVRQALECARERPVVSKPGRPFNKPAIKRALDRRHARPELGLEAGRVADQISGMNLEKFRQELTRVVGQVPPRAVFTSTLISSDCRCCTSATSC